MSAIASIAILDGATVPVTHTFNPVTVSPIPMWREAVTGLALVGQGSAKVSVAQDKGTGLNKVKIVLDMPALEVVTGSNTLGYSAAPKVAYSNRVNLDFILPSRGTSQQRKDIRTLLANLLLNAQVIDSIENLNAPY